jgi:hypothetical protein
MDTIATKQRIAFVAVFLFILIFTYSQGITPYKSSSSSSSPSIPSSDVLQAIPSLPLAAIPQREHTTPDHKNVVVGEDWMDGGKLLQYLRIHPVGSDKVSYHCYEAVYAKAIMYLGDVPYNVLEIGLGCGMQYGPGYGYLLFTDILPKTQYSFLEYNEKCFQPMLCDPSVNGAPPRCDKNPLEHLKPKDMKYLNDHATWGSQASPEVMQKAVSRFGPFRLILDDGSHHSTHQVASLVHFLQNGLEPGGVYVIEDLICSYSQRAVAPPPERTAVHFIQDLLILLHVGGNRRADIVIPGFDKRATLVAAHIQSICCDREICSFTKLTADGVKENVLMQEYKGFHGIEDKNILKVASPSDMPQPGIQATLVVLDARQSVSSAVSMLERLLLDHVTPGGSLIVTHMEASYDATLGAGAEAQRQEITLASYIHNWLRLMHARWYPFIKLWTFSQRVSYTPSVRWVRTVECERYSCVIRKRYQVTNNKTELYMTSKRKRKGFESF